MRTTVNNSGSSESHLFGAISKQLRDDSSDELKSIYRELSVCLDNIQDLLYFLDDTNGKVCLTVLEDDVSDLLEECGEYLLMAEEPKEDSLISLECRTCTVIEELKGVLKP